MSLVAAPPWVLVAQWSARSQERARRNAMAACTDLAARRLERLDVEAFIADFLARRAAASQPVGSIAGVG